MKGSKLDGICEFYDIDGNLEQRVNFKELMKMKLYGNR